MGKRLRPFGRCAVILLISFNAFWWKNVAAAIWNDAVFILINCALVNSKILMEKYSKKILKTILYAKHIYLVSKAPLYRPDDFVILYDANLLNILISSMDK